MSITPVSDIATPRYACPGCGRATSPNHVSGLLWVHDRIRDGVRELCPGSRSELAGLKRVVSR